MIQPDSPRATDRISPDAALDEQSVNWRGGHRIPVEDFLERNPALREDPEGLLDLIVHEMSLRQRAGELPRPEDYLSRFPWLGDRLEAQLQLQGLFQTDGLSTDPGDPAGLGALPTAPAGFAFVEVIGRGGMGVVYLARQVALNRRVALKIVVAGPHAEPARLARIRIEAEAMARLQHPNVIQIFEVGEHDGCPFLALEFVEGTNLSKAFARTPQDPRRVAALVETLARAVHQVHQNGIIHRDLKPANILVATDGTPKIADFGLAKLLEAEDARTDSGTVLGTPSYMAPEQAMGHAGRIGPTTDVYALGAILYEGLTGRPPFQGRTPLETFQQVLTAEVVPPSRLLTRVPHDLETIILKCLRKDAARRYADAETLADDLRRFLHDRPIQARRSGPAERAARWCRRNPTLATALGLTSMALLAVAGLSTGFAVYERRVADRLQTERATSDRERRRAELLALDLALDRGLDGPESHDAGHRLLWLAEALRLARPEDIPTQEAIRANLSAWAAHVRPLRQIFSAGGPITAVGFRPDGRVIITATRDGRAQLWRVADGARLGNPIVHAASISVVRFGADGRRVLTASEDGTAWLWNSEDGSPVGQAMIHRGPIRSASLSLDGRLVATAGEDGTARLWSAVDGKATGVVLSCNRPVIAVALSADARLVLTGGPDGTASSARLWRVADGVQVASLPHGPNTPQFVSFSPDGRRVLTAGNDGKARLWSAGDGTPVGRPMAHLDPIRAAVFRPDGRTILTAGDDGTARLWDADTGAPIGEPMPHQSPVVTAAFSPDGRTVITGALDNMARLWDADTGAPIGSPLVHQGPVVAATFGPGNGSILTAGDDGTARLWEANPPAPTGWTVRHEGAVLDVGFSPDGRTVLSGSRDNTARLVRGADGMPVATLRHEGYVHSVEFFPDGQTVMTASHDGTVKFWEPSTGSLLGRPIVDPHSMMAAAVRPDGRALATGNYAGKAFLHNLTTGRPIDRAMGHGDWIHVAIFSPDGRRLLTTSHDGTARLWDADDGHAVGPPLSHRSCVNSAAFSPDGRLAITGSNDGTARVWRAEDGVEIGSPMPHQDAVLAVAFSPDGRTIATSGRDNAARLWDGDGRPRGVSVLHRGPIVALAFSPDGKTLLTGSSDSSARLWRVADGSPIGPPMVHRGPVLAAAFSPDGRSILTGSRDHTVRLWPAPVVLAGDASRISLWVTVITGIERTEGRNRVRVLDSATWQDRRRQLGGFGDGPF